MNDQTAKSAHDRAAAEPLAIVGMGCLFPKAGGLAPYWANILAGVDATGEVPESHWRPDDYFDADPSSPDRTYARRGAFLDPVDFNPLHYGLNPNSLEATDTTQLLGLVVAERALRDAGYALAEGEAGRKLDRRRTSCILGVTGALELVIPLGARLGHPHWRRAMSAEGVDEEQIERVLRRIGEAYVPWQEHSFPGLLGNVAAGRIANRFDLGGTNCVVDAACASSLSAIHMAAMELHLGRADMVLAGGLDTFNDIFMYMCFSKTPALSPTGESRPLSAAADGTLLGEGLGIVTLKRWSDARRDGDRVYALIRGIGSSSDGRGNAIYAPSAKGQVEALRSAYRAANVSPETIELIEAHGTGTKVGDAVEIEALSQVFQEEKRQGRWCAVGSVKSMVGHTKAAAGVAGLIKATLALHHKVLPATIKVDAPAESLEDASCPLYVNTQSRPWLPERDHPRRAGVSAFGFGGSNFHCVLEEADASAPAAFWDGRVQVVPIGQTSETALANELRELRKAAVTWPSLRRAAASYRRRFEADAPVRAVLILAESDVADGTAEMRIDRAIESLERDVVPSGADRDLMFGRGQPSGGLAVLFPGQGSQRVNMLLDLACRFPSMLASLAEGNCAFASDSAGERLSDLIYPIPAFADAERQKQNDALRETRVAQPALAAVSWGAWQTLTDFGVRPDATAGHSFGELVALAAAGVLSPADLFRLAAERGRLMAEASQSSALGKSGAMLAVAAPCDVVEALLGDANFDVHVANVNAPQQVVLSGSKADIERAAKWFAERGHACKRLAVSAAFHSPAMSGAGEKFEKIVREATWQAPTMPVYANVTGRPYPNSADNAGNLLTDQLTRAVQLVECVENLYADGCRTFLEVGPGNVLSGLVRQILDGRPHVAVSLDESKGRATGVHDLARALAHLAAAGHPVDWTKWDPPPADEPVAAAGKRQTMTIPICGANYVKPRSGERHVEAVVRPRPDLQRNHVKPKSGGSQGIVRPRPDLRANYVEGKSSEPALSHGTEMAKPTPQVSNEALQFSQQAILALQKMQEQTARLHQQYLEGQQSAQRTLAELLRQQQQLIAGGSVPSPLTSVTPVETASSALAPSATRQPPVAPVDRPVMQNRPRDVDPRQAADHERSHPLASRAEAHPAASESSGQVMQSVLDVISQMTGYPSDVLTPEMSLDVDLGIDSIKRVEIFAELQDRLPELSPVAAEELNGLATLREVAELLDAAMSGPAAQGQEESNAERPAAPAAANLARVMDALLDVVADKTGYPAEMLDREMSLDDDLGIDSIKRVEILAALQDRLPELPDVGSEVLSGIDTLGDIVTTLENSLPPSEADREPAAPTPNEATNPSAADGITDVLLAVVADKTGYPTEMLELEMRLDDELGIDSIKRVEIFSALQDRLPGMPELGADDLAGLDTLTAIVDRLGGTVNLEPDAAVERPSDVRDVAIEGDAAGLERYELRWRLVERPAAAPHSWSGSITVTDDSAGLSKRIVAALREHGIAAQLVDAPPEEMNGVSGLVIVAPPKADDEFVVTALAWMQRYQASLTDPTHTGSSLLAGVVRMDGHFGLSEASTAADDYEPTAAGLCGLVKSAAAEWPEVDCRVIDAAADVADLDGLAKRIAEELLRNGPLELGLSADAAGVPELVARQLERAAENAADHGLVVISGGARGVTAEAAVALASSRETKLLLLGRTEAPVADPEWLAGLDGEAEIKHALLKQTDVTTPREIERQYQTLMAQREIRRTLSRLAALGVEAIYESVDIRDAAAVAAAVDTARKRFGPVRGVVHGAGVLADRLIEDLNGDDVRQVMGTKVDGLRNLLAAVGNDPLARLAVFSSSTARFGRKGQAAYAAANEVLNKMAQRESRRRTKCRVRSLNWGPWDGGMVTPALKRQFDAEGIRVIPLAAGARELVAELAEAPSPREVEVVVLGEGSAAVIEPAEKPAREPVVPRAAELSLALTRQVSTAACPVLRSHVMNHRAVLPVALMVEWLAHGALHDNIGLEFHGIEDLRVYKGVTVDADQQQEVGIWVGPAQADETGQRFQVDVELRGDGTLHAGGRITLADALPPAPESSDVASSGSVPPGDPYADGRLFHGPDLQGIHRVLAVSETGIRGQVATAPSPAGWLERPLRRGWLADPLALDSAFQLIVLWTWQMAGRASLPTRVEGYRQFRPAFPPGSVQVVADIQKHSEHAVVAQIDWIDEGGQLVARLDRYHAVVDASLREAFARNRLLEGAAR